MVDSLELVIGEEEIHIRKDDVTDFYRKDAPDLAKKFAGHWNFYLTPMINPAGTVQLVLEKSELDDYRESAERLYEIYQMEEQKSREIMDGLRYDRPSQTKPDELFELYKQEAQLIEEIKVIFDKDTSKPIIVEKLLKRAVNCLKDRTKMYDQQTRADYLARPW